MFVAEIDGEECVAWANPALSRACGEPLVGMALGTLIVPASLEALRSHVATDRRCALLVQFTPPRSDPFSLRVFIEVRSAGFALVGEPPWEDHRALEVQLQALNNELAVLSRDHARRAKELEQALAELRDSHWHLQKIADVLPMCVECRAVRTGADSWEDVSEFLIRSADFLSHGYCARCAAALDRELPPGDGAG